VAAPPVGAVTPRGAGWAGRPTKTYREQTGAGLAEAKAAVEVIARERGL
jgi:hypothetical protein